MRWTSSFAFILSFSGLLGCAVFKESRGPDPVAGPVEKVFYGTFEEVWRATQLALQSPTSYPLRINNMDTGFLETEPLKGSLAWRPAHINESYSSGYSYRLVIRVIRGDMAGNKAFKVSVLKDAQIQRDFFANPEHVPSDGLEEKMLLYRVERELVIDRAIRRAQKIKNQG